MLIASLSLGSCASFQKSKAPENLPAAFQDSETDSDGEFRLPHETNPFRFIPPGAFIQPVMVKTEYGLQEGLWYDEECKSDLDYKRKFKEGNGRIDTDKIFIDADGDGIIDLSVEDFNNAYNKYIQRQELLNKST